jgi:hypothetical protein
MFIILVSYRARGIQQFRREQIIKSTENFKTYFEKHNIEYKIIISEQNNDNKFNRGLLLNAAFLEGEKLFNVPRKYIHMNADYFFNLSREFPQELLDFKEGFVDMFRHPHPILGSACAFDAESYKTINGFPNDLEGWGGDDWAIYNRIMSTGINLMTPEGLFNSNFILEEVLYFGNDISNNNRNIELARRDDISSNGLNSIKYTVDGHGEFNDGHTIFHYLIGSE